MDNQFFNRQRHQHRNPGGYPVRVYDDLVQLKPFFQHISLELVDEVHNFGLNINEICKPGGIDYVFQKK